jgi:propionyl-CoA carboxylase alpha chain
MGSKLAAKECVRRYDIPMVPGIDTAIDDISLAKETALSIGYPILIKASAGGGGKGMRIVDKEADFEEQMQRAISEAEASFGDGSVFIEKYVASPRHVEIQVLADNYGNTIHLFERECSIQRRHQKVVEEAPSAVLSPELRDKMGAAAIMVAKSCNYTSTGTVEFLVDDALNFYFLEMNTRLQVEHPVTEMITGIDLVEEQIRIARGERLRITQDDLRINGHAVELRVYAEDPLNDFLPSIGTISTYIKPEGVGVRVDDGYEQGMSVPIYYDPLLAKLVTHGKDRTEAIQRMKAAIKDFKIQGVCTTLPFGSFVFEHEAFLSGNFDTHFIKDSYTPELIKEKQKANAEAAAIIAIKYWLEQQKILKVVEHKSNSWKRRLS